MQLVRLCLLALAVAALTPARPADRAVPAVLWHAGSASRCAPAGEPATRAKPSSFAPHGHSGRRVYGAPIQRPIVSRSRHPRHHGAKAGAKKPAH